jgi:phage baseplate assembly protein W
MEVIVDTSKGTKINWNAKGRDRIIQNTINLINTLKYEVAYDRTLGLSGTFIDKPMDIAIADATAEIYEIISEMEPRATVKEVNCLGIFNEEIQFEVVMDID